LAVSSATALSN